MNENRVRVFRVFVSSPGDVGEERNALDNVVAAINHTDGQRHGFRLELFKWERDATPWLGPGPQPAVDAWTPEYDVYLGIMSTRFGTPTERAGSGTEDEFNAALERWRAVGAPWIMFYFDVAPQSIDDEERYAQLGQVLAFRKKLDKLGLVARYQGVEGGNDTFRTQVELHLRKVAARLVAAEQASRASTASNASGSSPVSVLAADGRSIVVNGPATFIIHGANPSDAEAAPAPSADPTQYLEMLRERNSHIEIRGLQVSSGRAPRFPIDALYIPLKTTAAHGGARDAGRMSPEQCERRSNRVELREALVERQLVIIGDPGAGKTTMLRRIAHLLADALLKRQSSATLEQLGWAEPLFPLWIRVADVAQLLERHSSPMSLAQVLAHVVAADNVGLNQAFFERQLAAGRAVVLLDGLDEAPNDALRKQVAELLERTSQRYPGCRYVVTSRPAAIARETVLPGYAQVEIEALENDAIETFLRHWCEALFADSPALARQHLTELLDALRQRLEIRRMARNPVMLTALAVVHWNEKRLPEQRADLYESIILWLARARGHRSGRLPPERCIVYLQDLALAMQNHPSGRQTQVTRHWAAEQLARHWRELPEDQRLPAAWRFLEDEEGDSGIIVRRGDYLRYWHLTFQEYLAARALTDQDAERGRILARQTLYAAEWKEVALLLAGALYHQGPARVDAMFSAILDSLGPRATLVDKALCVGLLGGAVHDLSVMRYQPSDPRYQQLLRDVEAVFEPQWLGQAESASPDKSWGGIWNSLMRRATFRPTLEHLERMAIRVADVLGQVGTLRYDPARLDRQWISIPAGRFWMGAQSGDAAGRNYDPEMGSIESPVHEVELSAFHIARFPVTVGQYRRFVESDGYVQPRFWVAGGLGKFTSPENWEEQIEYPGCPVVGVSWYEAAAYCVWRGVQLPTEAQWERAARGIDGRKYPWGDTAPTRARLNFDQIVGHPTPIGIYPLGASPEGVEELAGNVWEWCADGYAEYPTESVVNPLGAPQHPGRVVRGGSWYLGAWYCRSAFRDESGADNRYRFRGFRVCLVPGPDSVPHLARERGNGLPEADE